MYNKKYPRENKKSPVHWSIISDVSNYRVSCFKQKAILNSEPTVFLIAKFNIKLQLSVKVASKFIYEFWWRRYNLNLICLCMTTL